MRKCTRQGSSRSGAFSENDGGVVQALALLKRLKEEEEREEEGEEEVEEQAEVAPEGTRRRKGRRRERMNRDGEVPDAGTAFADMF